MNSGFKNESNINYLDYPQNIKVSGFPFMLQGWNNTFYKSGKDENGDPIYRLDSYNLYWLIPTIGASIRKNDFNNWVFVRDCDEITNPLYLNWNNKLLGEWRDPRLPTIRLYVAEV